VANVAQRKPRSTDLVQDDALLRDQPLIGYTVTAGDRLHPTSHTPTAPVSG
jgi:hypothetical protein